MWVLTLISRFDAEQRGLMTDSTAKEDSLLEGFKDPWPAPSSSVSAFQSSTSVTLSTSGGENPQPGAMEDKSISLSGPTDMEIVPVQSEANSLSDGDVRLQGEKTTSRFLMMSWLEEMKADHLVMPAGIRLKHAVQVSGTAMGRRGVHIFHLLDCGLCLVGFRAAGSGLKKD